MRLIIMALLFISFKGFGQIQPLKISPLTSSSFVFTTWQNISGHPFPSNGLYVVTYQGVVMIDSPWDTTQLQPILDTILKRHQKKVVMVLATHSHEDRTGGLSYYNSLGIPTYTTVLTDEISQVKGQHRAKNLISKDTTFSIGGTRFSTYYAGKGHTADNIVVWFEKEKILYGGCLVKSTEAKDLGNISEADLNAYPETIRNVLNKYKETRFVIPGHQSWENKKSLEHTLNLLKQQ